MKRIPQLDGVRGVAILLVLVYHFVVLPIGTDAAGRLGAIARVLGFGWGGVDLFFVLSGFLIGGILWDHRGAANYFAVFYLRRAARIFPVYYLVLAAFGLFAASGLAARPAFAWLAGAPLPAWSYLAFLQNLVMGFRDTYGANWFAATWSLAIEEQFYLVVPLLVRFLPRRALLALLGAAVAAAPFLRLLAGGKGAYVFPWCRADALLSGVALALLVRSDAFARRAAAIDRAAPWALAGLVAGGVALKAVHAPQTWQHSLLAALGCTLVLVARRGGDGPGARLLGSPVLVWFGRLSYGLYLCHQVVLGLLHGAVLGKAPGFSTPAEQGVSVLAFAATLALAAASERWLERPLLARAHRVAYRPA